MSRSTVTTLAQLRSLPVGTTLAMPLTGELAGSPLACIVKVEETIYATPSEEPGRVWSYYSESELTGEIQGDPDAAWFPLLIEEIPTAPDRETYPKSVMEVTVASREDDGAQYTLVYPDGKRVPLGDAEDNYGALAEIIDSEHGKADRDA